MTEKNPVIKVSAGFQLKRIVRVAARFQNRSISNLMQHAVVRYIKQYVLPNLPEGVLSPDDVAFLEGR